VHVRRRAPLPSRLPGRTHAGAATERRDEDAALDDLTKTQLGVVAKELDISGRSRMTAKDLRTAIEKARRAPERRRAG
jgi:DNA end-binding protein Ku